MECVRSLTWGAPQTHRHEVRSYGKFIVLIRNNRKWLGFKEGGWKASEKSSKGVDVQWPAGRGVAAGEC